MPEYITSCRGCHGGCMHILTVQDGRVTKVRPDPNGPLNQGRACPKGMSIIEQMYHPDRLLYPMRRIGPKRSGKWERISWDEAYDEIGDRLTCYRETYGPECIAVTNRHRAASPGAVLAVCKYFGDTERDVLWGADLPWPPKECRRIYHRGVCRRGLLWKREARWHFNLGRESGCQRCGRRVAMARQGCGPCGNAAYRC